MEAHHQRRKGGEAQKRRESRRNVTAGNAMLCAIILREFMGFCLVRWVSGFGLCLNLTNSLKGFPLLINNYVRHPPEMRVLAPIWCF